MSAEVEGTSFNEVTFYAKVGNGDCKSIGTDDTRPYRVFHDVFSIPDGTNVSYRAAVRDNSGHTRLSERERGVVPKPELTIKLPAERRGRLRRDRGAGRCRSRAGIACRADPATEGTSGPGPQFETDDSSPIYVYYDDLAAVPVGTTIQYRAILNEPDGTRVVSAVRTVNRVAPQPLVEQRDGRGLDAVRSWLSGTTGIRRARQVT